MEFTTDDDLWNNVLTNRIPILALLSARSVPLIGDELALLAVPWFVLQTTGSAMQAGITAAATVLPRIVSGIFGGTLVDRLGFKRTSIVADLVSGFTVALIPLLHATIGIAFWQLLLLVFLGSLLDNAGNVARNSLIPDLSAAANIRLERVNSAFGSVNSATILIGPIVAGFLIAALGPSEVLWFDAVTFALSATLVTIAVPTPVRLNDGSNTDDKYLAQLAEGVTFVLRERLILVLLIIGSGEGATVFKERSWLI